MPRGSAEFLVLLLTTGCAASLREAPTPAPKRLPQALPWSLNRELLAPDTKEIRFIVDHMAGRRPEFAALDDLVALASRYADRPASWTLRARPLPVRLEPDTTYVFVRYVGAQLPAFGRAYARRVDDRWVYFIIVNQEAHRRFSAFIPERRLEQQTLIHEYGHLLGLPTPDHGYFPHYPAVTDGLHCVNPDCPLSKPRPRAVLYNLVHGVMGHTYLEDYCAECRRALAAGQRYFRAAP